MNQSPHQDFKQVVFNKSNTTTQSKQYTHVNDFQSHQNALDKKLENDEMIDINKNKVKTQELRKKLIEYRMSNKMSQANIAKKISIQSNIINEIEKGKLIPPPDIANKIKRLIGFNKS